MKVKNSIKRVCKGCYIVRRKGRLELRCTEVKSHKYRQRNMSTWVSTVRHAPEVQQQKRLMAQLPRLPRVALPKQPQKPSLTERLVQMLE
ncbi:MAG: hypothetical protein MHM6MM_007488 [Cercozoa sp. M6MM]